MKSSPLVFGALTLITASIAIADGDLSVCAQWSKPESSSQMVVSIPQCGTAAASVAGAVGSGIYAAKNYGEAERLMAAKNEAIFTNSTNSFAQASTLDRTAQTFRDGDRITVQYHLSLDSNRAYHISKLQGQSEAARRLADDYSVRAQTLTKEGKKTIVIIDAEGNARSQEVSIGQVADEEGRIHYANKAIEERIRVRTLQREIELVRAGRVEVPVYSFRKVIDASQDTRALATKFMSEQTTKGSMITRIERMAAEDAIQWRSLISRGRTGVVGVAAGAAVAVEEVAVGAIANSISNATNFKPAAGTR